jgi:DNA-binding NtrC family response regulator
MAAFKMDFARSAADALQLIDAVAGETLILILSDINMPGMSALNLLLKVRSARPDVPVIMITAYATQKFVMRSRADVLLTPRGTKSSHPRE